MSTPIWVTIIAGAFSVVVALIEKGRRENKRDHGNVMDRLDLISGEIRKDIRKVGHDLTSHINGPQHAAPTSTPAQPAKLPRKRVPKSR